MKENVPGLRYAAKLVEAIKVPPPESCPPELGMTEREAIHAYSGSVVMQQQTIRVLNKAADLIEEAAG